ncbi:MAG: helix-turn-helix transcriptional regulator [Coriobacteriales bacterium]|nr:helix-turn-helix transcriptional regulator [Coriobacteriales bacterium]
MGASKEQQDHIRRNIGRRIGVLRDAQAISQSKFAMMVGMDRSYLNEIEHGTRNVSLSYLVRIARGFGITLSELFEGVDDVPSQARELRQA